MLLSFLSVLSFFWLFFFRFIFGVFPVFLLLFIAVTQVRATKQATPAPLPCRVRGRGLPFFVVRRDRHVFFFCPRRAVSDGVPGGVGAVIVGSVAVSASLFGGCCHGAGCAAVGFDGGYGGDSGGVRFLLLLVVVVSFQRR